MRNFSSANDFAVAVKVFVATSARREPDINRL